MRAYIFRRGEYHYSLRIIAILALLFWAGAVPAADAQTSASAQPKAPRILDVTARNDGWVFAQALAVSGSAKNRIVIISYLDEKTTRAFYDIAVEFTRPPYKLPIFGVVRAPAHPTEPNPDGFNVYVNGTPFNVLTKKDREAVEAISKPAWLRELLIHLKKSHYQ